MVQKTLTAANSVYMLAVRGLYPIAQLLQGYATDAAFDTDASEPTENVMGVDGKMSSGFVPFMTMQTINLQADSDSVEVFENWLAAMKTAREVLYADATVILPSVQRKYSLTQGSLSSVPPIPGSRKILQPRAFRITWADISPAPFG